VKARRVTLLLLLLAAAGALWVWRGGLHWQAAQGVDGEAAQAAYDYEARQVVLRQIDPDGRLQFQVEAQEIVQLPDGRITARGLTLYHDPAGSEPGGPNRWTLTADSGELPAEGGVVTLAGHVQASGVPVGSRGPVTFATTRLRYDMTRLELCSDDEVQLAWGGNSARSQGLCFNVGTSEVTGSEGNAILVPQ
jgi:LPS export ABC transporter protein LptC